MALNVVTLYAAKCTAASIIDRFISRDVEAIGALGRWRGEQERLRLSSHLDNPRVIGFRQRSELCLRPRCWLRAFLALKTGKEECNDTKKHETCWRGRLIFARGDIVRQRPRLNEPTNERMNE